MQHLEAATASHRAPPLSAKTSLEASSLSEAFLTPSQMPRNLLCHWKWGRVPAPSCPCPTTVLVAARPPGSAGFAA